MRIIKSNPQTARANMAVDEELLDQLDTQADPILHFYNWQYPAATYGRFIDPADYFVMGEVKQEGFDLARRPTGGGIVFHNSDLAFSFLVPASHRFFSVTALDNYAFVNGVVKRAIERCFGFTCDLEQQNEADFALRDPCERFCMAHPTRFDVMWKNKKVAGAAQRKTRAGYLHQGSIFLGFSEASFYSRLLCDAQFVKQMSEKSVPLLTTCNERELGEARRRLTELLIEEFTGLK